MSHRTRTLGLALVLALAAGSAAPRPVHADEIVRLDQVPPAVRATIMARLAGGSLVEIERTTDHGRVLFEVDVRTDTGIVEFDVEENGAFAGYENDGPEDEDQPEDPEEEEEEEDDGDDDEDDDEDDDQGVQADHVEHEPLARDRDVLIPTPLADRDRFSPIIDHPYLPLSEVRWTELRSEDGERVVREVLDRTQMVAGVECLILAEHEYEGTGDDEALAEISYNFFAQDQKGNVYYFGEEVDDYEDGQVVGHGGAWQVGKNADEPCLFLPADLELLTVYKPENSPPDASEWALIGSVTAEFESSAGEFKDVLVILESNHDDRWEERKYYARGIGLVSENRSLNLVEVRHADAQP